MFLELSPEGEAEANGKGFELFVASGEEEEGSEVTLVSGGDSDVVLLQGEVNARAIAPTRANGVPHFTQELLRRLEKDFLTLRATGLLLCSLSTRYSMYSKAFLCTLADFGLSIGSFSSKGRMNSS